MFEVAQYGFFLVDFPIAILLEYLNLPHALHVIMPNLTNELINNKMFVNHSQQEFNRIRI
jgi:ABC-type amino acid transport system permease subunit